MPCFNIRKAAVVPLSVCLGAALCWLFINDSSQVAGQVLAPPCQDVNSDGQSDVSDAVYFLNWLFLGGPSPDCPTQNLPPPGLPATGQTLCYSTSALVDCADASCTGQDGHYRTGCPSQTRFVDNVDGTVTDACTALTWQKDIGDVDDDGQSTANDTLPWCDALAYCENLNLGDRSDWRLPNVRELQSLVDYGRFNFAMDPLFDGVLISPVFWSASTYVQRPESAWIVKFGVGTVDRSEKTSKSHYVRAVCDSQ